MTLTLRGNADFEATRKELMRIKGVNSVELNIPSNKVRVRYDGAVLRNEKIRTEIKRILARGR